MRVAIYTLILLFLFHLSVDGQEQIRLSVSTETNAPLPGKNPETKTYSTPFEVQLALKTYIQELFEIGYLSASIDSITGDSIQKTAHLFLGPKFEWVELNTDSVDEEILTRTGFRDKQFRNKPFNPKQISTFFNRALTYLENNGYPFAEIKLNNVQVVDDKISADVLLAKNTFYTIDSIQILGEKVNLQKNYIENLIRVKSHQIYDEQIIRDIGKRIQDNPYISELKPFEVIFTEESCKIILILKPKKANSFDGIIGLQPQPNNQKSVLTGDVKIGLGNIIGQGERLFLRWQRLQNQTQEINAHFNIPFLLKTPIGIGYAIDIYRQDTTYNNVEQKIAIPYTMNNGSIFEVYFNQFRTSLISTFNYQNATSLPPFIDANNTIYGVGYTTTQVTNTFNPYKGWTFHLHGGAGNNKIVKNAALEQVNYDSIQLETPSIEAAVKANYFQPITRNTTLMIGIQSALKQSDNLVENQLYRIGGLNTLRGFDEQSIFASAYTVATIEYRLLFDEYSRIVVFYDLGWYEQRTLDKFITDTPYGFGAGITFQTNVGMFSLNYAIGNQQNNPINFRTGKIHFGFVNYF